MAILSFRAWIESGIVIPACGTNSDDDYNSKGVVSKYATKDGTGRRERKMFPSPEARFGIMKCKKK